MGTGTAGGAPRHEGHHPDAVLSARDRGAAGAALRARERAGASGPPRDRAHRDAELPRREDLSGVRWVPEPGTPRRRTRDPHANLSHAARRFPRPARELLLVRLLRGYSRHVTAAALRLSH